VAEPALKMAQETGVESIQCELRHSRWTTRALRSTGEQSPDISRMNIETFSAAATVAMTTTVAFLLIARSFSTVNRRLGNASRFPDSIMHEAAQRFRDELDRISASQSIYFAGILVFAMLFAAACVLQAEALFAGYPSWQLGLQIGFIALTVAFAAYKLTRTVLTSRQLRFQRDATTAIGHQLQQVGSATTHVFHDVRTTAGVIDHVVISRVGVYAVNVIARRPHPGASAQVVENQLHFSDSEEQPSVVPLLAKNTRLAKHLTRLIGQRVRVRSIIALPGWETTEQSDDRHLVVNERNVSMLLGWRDKSDYLMDDDVLTLREDLRSRCRKRAGDQRATSI
jgi:hypothetical protein